MKILQSYIFRAVCAIVIGILLVAYAEDFMKWITIAIGIIFLLSGIISVVAYFSAKKKSSDSDVDIYDANGKLITSPKPSFPIVGLGSILLGAILALMPTTFMNWLTYVFAAILILGAVNQYFNLTAATRFSHIGFVWWVCPGILLLIGLIAIIKPSLIQSAPLLVLGWCMIVYGVISFINSIKINHCRKQFAAIEAKQSAQNENQTQEEPES